MLIFIKTHFNFYNFAKIMHFKEYKSFTERSSYKKKAVKVKGKNYPLPKTVVRYNQIVH